MKYFIDAGANNSCSARIFRKINDLKNEYHIYSFEIDPAFVNNFSDIPALTFVNKAVWIDKGTMPFYRCLAKNRDGGTLLKEKRSNILDKGNPIAVDTIDFSKWILDTFNKEDEIILKMDIEGAEYAVLEKMIEDGSFDYINELWIEWHGKKVGVSDERHNALVNRIKIPTQKWCGLEDAEKVLGAHYLKGVINE